MKSMTGFGSVTGEVGARRVTVEARSVNHRFFNASIKLPLEFARFEHDVREVVRKEVSRGHVSVSVRSEAGSLGSAGINEERFAAWAALGKRLQHDYALPGLDVAAILRLPDVLSSTEEPSADESAALLGLVARAASALNTSREAEGARLGAYVLERLGVIESALDRIRVSAPARIVRHRDKLLNAVKELTSGIALDEQRLAMEIAVLAERFDVDEELSRFAIHNKAFRGTVDAGRGDPVGKRLGFLLQEMLRETNTTGSKANDAVILADVVVIKEELERIREQVENLE